jgi:hypothetical protein
MASIGKKILSAFMEVGDETKNAPAPDAARVAASGGGQISGVGSAPGAVTATDQRFADYFDILFKDANIPGPDYYEFARMIAAMQAIPDEHARYAAAFAGLQVQGLDKARLLSTAAEYLQVLKADADHFGSSFETALQEKVLSRTAEVEEKSKRIQALSKEITDLQTQIGNMQNEIGEAKGKLEANSSAYAAESEKRKQTIQIDIEKIDRYIH